LLHHFNIQQQHPEYFTLSYDLANEREKYKSIANEMDQTFAELAGF